MRSVLAAVLVVASVLGAFALCPPGVAPSAALAGVCLTLWLAEAVPPFVPTLVLLALGPLATGLETREVLGWFADPVLVLFFGGFALGEAASSHGIDRRIVEGSVRAARGQMISLVAIVLLATAFLSMWISNVAAAALLVAALRPMLVGERARALLLAVALGANLGGMATPIGSGPNAIAIAALPRELSFVGWMAMAAPLVSCALGAAFLWIVAVRRVTGSVAAPPALVAAHGERPVPVAAVAVVAIGLWLTGPLHGIPAAVVSAGVAAVLFASGLLRPGRLAAMDWSTLLLVAGGIGLGGLLDHLGFASWVGSELGGLAAPRVVVLGALLLAAAGLSSVMSNTGATTLLVPVAVALLPEVPGAPILVALASSFGMPFVVSTPPNAMATGAGLPPRDLLAPGLLLLAGGVLVLSVTGPRVLALLAL